MDNIIDVKGLKRSFKTLKNGEFEAIKGIDFSVKEGEIFGLLGKLFLLSVLMVQVKQQR